MAGKKGRSGRPPKPAHLHLVDGTHKRSRHGDRKDAVAVVRKALAAGCPPRPKWVSGPIARGAWQRHAKTLHARGMLTAADVDLFGMYCLAVAEYRALAKIVQAEGHTVATSEGSVKLNPNVTAMNQAAKRVRDLGIEFGLSPVARVRAPGAPKDAADEERADLARRMGGRGRSS